MHKCGNLMYIINNAQRIVLRIALFALTLGNVDLTAMLSKSKSIISAAATTLPNCAIKVEYTTPTGNEVSAVQLQLHDTTTNGQFVKLYKGKELCQTVAETTKEYPTKTLEEAITKKLEDSLKDANLGNPKKLITLLDPSRHERNELDINNLELRLESSTGKKQLSAQIKQETEQHLATLEHQKAIDLARTTFEQNAISNNAQELGKFLGQLKARQQLRVQARQDNASFQEIIGGIHRLNQKTVAFFESQSIKTLLDLYNTTLFEGNLITQAKKEVEAQWNSIKFGLGNHYLTVKNGSLVFNEPSSKIKEIFAYSIANLSSQCAPEVFEIFYDKIISLPEFTPVVEYVESQMGNWFQRVGKGIIYHATNFTDYAPKWFTKNTIDWSPELQQNADFKKLATIDILCREGKFESARSLAAPDFAIGQQLIEQHYKLSPLGAAQKQPATNSAQQEAATQPQMPLIDSMSIKIAQDSITTNFPVNAYTVNILKDYIGQDSTEITPNLPDQP